MHVNPLQTVKEALRGDVTVVFECPECGTTVDDETEPCSSCGHDRIARYEIR